MQYFASHLEGPSGDYEHKDCTLLQCLAHQSQDGSEYVTIHVDPNCRCNSVYTSQKGLYNILRAGLIPLIHVSESSPTAFDTTFHLIPSSDSAQYIAKWPG